MPSPDLNKKHVTIRVPRGSTLPMRSTSLPPLRNTTLPPLRSNTSLPPPQKAARAFAAQVFAALGDKRRLSLVQRLSTGPASVSTLSEGSRITRQGVTKHLRVLAKAGLVQNRKRGRESIWQLNTDRLQAAQSALDQISQEWDSTLLRLREFVEG
jgi:DNA-binding transcriptional ArsR family regulator